MEELKQTKKSDDNSLHRTSFPKSKEKEKFDAYQVVTDRIIELIENGVVPWQSPSIARVGYPLNFSTGKPYNGINVFLLGCQQFQSPYFLTFLQAKNLGGHIRKGEKGFPVIKVGSWEQKDEEKSEDDKSKLAKPIFLKVYTVFNSCQIEGVKFPELKKCETYTESTLAENAKAIVQSNPNPPIINEGRKSFPHYIPKDDTVEMPSRNTFHSELKYYKTLFHELAHATGHEKRLNRPSLTENKGIQAAGENRKIYCLEELVAEMTAAFLCANAGIIEDDFNNSAAYLKGWLDVLKVKDHKTWLVKAASDAQKASNYILGKSTENPECSNV